MLETDLCNCLHERGRHAPDGCGVCECEQFSDYDGPPDDPVAWAGGFADNH